MNKRRLATDHGDQNISLLSTSPTRSRPRDTRILDAYVLSSCIQKYNHVVRDPSTAHLARYFPTMRIGVR